MARLCILTLSFGLAAATGYLRFGAPMRHHGVWIDFVFLASTALCAALLLTLLIDRMRRTVHGPPQAPGDPPDPGEPGTGAR